MRAGTCFSLGSFLASGDSGPSAYLINLFVWASFDLSKDIEMPESFKAGFAASCGIRGAAYSAEDDNAAILVVFGHTVRVPNKSSSPPDSNPESSKSVMNED